MSAERLQKVLASAGIASRRDCEGLIAAGRVTVNGRVIQEPGTRVDLEEDVVEVDGQPVRKPETRTYLLLHKPVGFVSTVDDPQGRPTVIDLVDVPARVYPVGRLDVDSEGLLLLTDDGELTHQLTHPRFEIEKEYRALLDRPLDTEALRQWRDGVLLNGEPTAPAWVDLIETTEEGPWFRVVLREGRKRQIRDVARLLGYEVLRLIRVREGDLLLGDLPLRQWRPLTAEEVAALRAHVAARLHESPSARSTERSARPP
ncbi:MAG: rRNA pseudouridine synthase, partial [Oscillochloris sp.]|nr:rRNA pseudouridine synthase [Oscillochloris sp.]